MFHSLLQLIWDLTIHSLEGLAFSLAHISMSDSYTICNSSSSPLADIVFFGFFSFGLPLKILKRIGRFPRPYNKCFVLLSNQYGKHIDFLFFLFCTNELFFHPNFLHKFNINYHMNHFNFFLIHIRGIKKTGWFKKFGLPNSTYTVEVWL